MLQCVLQFFMIGFLDGYSPSTHVLTTNLNNHPTTAPKPPHNTLNMSPQTSPIPDIQVLFEGGGAGQVPVGGSRRSVLQEVSIGAPVLQDPTTTSKGCPEGCLKGVNFQFCSDQFAGCSLQKPGHPDANQGKHLIETCGKVPVPSGYAGYANNQ